MKTAAGWTTALAALLALSAHADTKGVRQIGRVSQGGGAMEVHWSGSGFETVLQGSKLEATIEDSGENFLSIEVDGQTFVLDLDPGRFVYTLFSGEPGSHTVRVTRRTSPIAAPTRISAIRSDGKLSAPPAPERRMLVIGDSISAGFGVDGEGPNCSFTYATQNQGRTYAALTARAFGAELYNLSVDGRGLVRNWDNASLPTLRELYKRRVPNSLSLWPAQANPVDVVVLHAGTNDFSGHRPGDSFTTAYQETLADLRASNPDAMIYALTGPSLSGEERSMLVNAVRGVVMARTQAGDSKVRFMDLQSAEGAHAWGCQWHPGVDTHAAIADKLQASIREELKW
jgi:lysophospholipase L1-like esterase